MTMRFTADNAKDYNSEVVIISGKYTSIGECAFTNKNSLLHVVIKNGIKEIGVGAFSSCINLQTVRFPEEPFVLNRDCFSKCVSLKEIIMPRGLKHIESGAFEGCTNLRIVDLRSAFITNIPATLFQNCFKLEEVLLPDSVVTINEMAFENCGMLKSISLPENLQTIGDDAFCHCSSLAEVVLPKKLVRLGSDVFSECESLKQIQLPIGIREIPYHCFTLCQSLTNVDMPGVMSIGSYVFGECTSLENVYLPSVSFIGTVGFATCTSLKSMSIGSSKGSVTLMNNFVSNCKSLEIIRIYGRAMFVPDGATHRFNKCPSLRRIIVDSKEIAREIWPQLDLGYHAAVVVQNSSNALELKRMSFFSTQRANQHVSVDRQAYMLSLLFIMRALSERGGANQLPFLSREVWQLIAEMLKYTDMDNTVPITRGIEAIEAF